MITIFEVLKQGKSLKDPAGWKKVGMTAQAIGIILTFVVHVLPFFGYTLPIEKETLEKLIDPASNGIATFLFILSFYLVPATSEKVSINPTLIGTGD